MRYKLRPHMCRTVGLLGGSFNPAHEGHVHISREALRRLGLDTVVWLVTPQNPHKRRADLADYQLRLKRAGEIAAQEPRIIVSDIERQLGTRYTIHTLRALQKRFPRLTFAWLMGADNLAGFHRWQHWREIAERVPIVIFDRAPFMHYALRRPAAQALAHRRQSAKTTENLAKQVLPAWFFFPARRHPGSATELRKTLGKRAFLVHNDKTKTGSPRKGVQTHSQNRVSGQASGKKARRPHSPHAR